MFVLSMLQDYLCSVPGFTLVWMGVGRVGGYPPWDGMVDGSWHHCIGAWVVLGYWYSHLLKS